MRCVGFLLLAFTCALVLALPDPATARPYRPTVRWRPVRPVRPVVPGRMPGWDWRRIYPWSPYNYGRNSYNPIILPYPYVYPPYYGGYSAGSNGGPPAIPYYGGNSPAYQGGPATRP
jgi:hypothetical protein